MTKKDVRDFRVHASIDAFYTGGSVQATDDGNWLLCACGSQVSVLEAASGLTRCKLGDAGSGQTTGSNHVTCIALQQDQRDTALLHVAVAHSSLNVCYYHVRFPQQASLEKDEKRDFTEEVDSTAPEVTLIRSWKSQHRGFVTQMVLSDDASILVTGSADSTLKVWHQQLQYCTHHIKQSSSPITSIRLFDQGRLLAVGNEQGHVLVCDLLADATKRVTFSNLTCHTSAITSISIQSLADHTVRLVVSSRDQTMTVFRAVDSTNPESFNKVRTLPLFESVEYFAPVLLKPDLESMEGKKLDADDVFMSAGSDAVIKLWDVSTGRKLYERSLKSKSDGATAGEADTSSVVQEFEVLACRRGTRYYVVSAEQNIHVLSAFNLAVQRQLVGHNDQIHDVTFIGNDARLLAVAANSTQLRIYDTDNMNCALVSLHDDLILAVAVCQARPSWIATASKDNTIAVCVLDDNNTLNTTVTSRGTGHTASVSCIRWCNTLQHSFIVTAADDNTLKIWPFDHKSPPKTLVASSTMVAHEKDITCVDVAPNDQLVATGSLDKTVRLWHVRQNAGGYVLEPAATIKDSHKRGVWDVNFSPTDQVLVTASGDCLIRIFALSDQSLLKTLEGHSSAVIRVCCMANGTQLLSSDTGGLVKMWSIVTGECAQTWEAHDAKVWALCHNWSHGRMVTGGSDSRVTIWNDVTDVLDQEQHERHVRLAEQQQQLDNLMQQKNYTEALRVALHLNRAPACLKALEALLTSPDGADRLQAVINALDDDRIEVLLKFIAQWNGSARTAQTAQTALNRVLRSRAPDDLLQMRSLQNHLEKLLPYTEKHYERLAGMRQQATFLQFMAKQATVLD